MKKIIISMMAAALLAGCTKSELGRTDSSELLALSLSAAIESEQHSTHSRAAIVGTKFPQMTPAFYLTAYVGAVAPTSWDPTSSSFSNIGVNSDASGLLTLTTAQYYPADAAKNLYFYAFSAPAASYTPGTASAAPIASYTITGQEDVMWVADMTGYNKTATPSPNLNFVHLLKQVNFKIKADPSFVETGWRVKSVTVKEVNTAISLPLNTGVAVFSNQSTLSLPITDQVSNTIGATEVVMDGNLMFEPGDKFKVDVVITDQNAANPVTFIGVDVTLTATTQGVTAGAKGVSHTVLLTFKKKGVVITSSITDWVNAGADINTDIM